MQLVDSLLGVLCNQSQLIPLVSHAFGVSCGELEPSCSHYSLPTPANYFILANFFTATGLLLYMGLATVFSSYIGLATGFTFINRPGPSLFFTVNQISFPDLWMYERRSLTFIGLAQLSVADFAPLF